ncbi:GroES-like protein [Glarea lozoyensis ATCC 20868]|uniref:GroES-like protein n=2 Tax=Glarea lozoyensis TaxID=101852 RepID=S3D4X0_GLAL2|nr:GroES-like protein [Glarea lozoyensis ATCC 20868]EHK97627.1 putative Zinc-binding alcohol dehydrogenase domain-containing protein cipB [Glarea lozoyensis 74030]EPE32149.1 GroES-like protein [Glarea lozoyensis ATCC 20868]
MAAPTNQAAWLTTAGTPLKVDEAPMPTAGPGELVVKNAAVAINPLDCHMQDVGVFVQQWPAIFGCDVAGEVHEVGSGAEGRFKKGDRVIGHAINLVTGRPQDGAYALYTVIPADKAAILPGNVSFTDGVVVPFALEAAVCALSLKVPGPAMPGVFTPALALPYPSLQPAASTGKVLVVYGGSSAVGSMTTQLATAAGIQVISIVGAHNFEFSKSCGAAEIFDHKDASVVDKVVEAVTKSGLEFVGIFDAIASPDTYNRDLAILSKLGGGHLACVHPPPPEVPENVKAGMIFAVNDIATPVWKDYVTSALESGKLKCLPKPNVVGKGLEHVNKALEMSKAGVSATKLVVEL